MKSDSRIISHFVRWPLLLAGLTAVAGIGLSLQLQSRIAKTEATTARLAAETLQSNTEQELTLFAEVLESVRALHALSDAVNQAAMDEFIEKGLVHQHAVLGTFGLTQRIGHWLRVSIEKKANEQPGTSYRVLKKASTETWVPSEPKAIYYPLTWQSRANGLDIPIGFDLSSLGDEARRTIERIELTRHTALVPSPTSCNNSNRPAFWVFSPVMPRPSEKIDEPTVVIGFAVAKLHPAVILDRVAANSGLSPKLQLTLMPPEKPEPEETIRRIDDRWLYRHPMEAIDAQWVFECSLPMSVTGDRSAMALAIGLIITALMTSQLLVLGSRTRKIEAEVRARTNDLHIAKARLEENLQERVRLEEEMNELAARERRRIGRDLHDSLGQKLTGAVFLSRSLLDYFSQEAEVRGQGTEVRDQRSETGDQRSKIGNRKSEIGNSPSIGNRDEVELGTANAGQRSGSLNSPIGNRQSAIGNHKSHALTLNETLKSAVGQVRDMARGLAPVALNDESLGEALNQLVEEMTGLYGVSCEVAECFDVQGLDRKTKEQLYLIAREAVNNAARHAQAGCVTVRLTHRNNSGWQLCVKDDGKGLPETQPAGEGMGIRIMRHRASLIGAELTIHSEPGKGTCVDVMREA